MREHHPKTQTMNITDFKKQLPSLVSAVYHNGLRVLIEKAGKPVVAFVSADDLERLSRFEQEREERFKVIDRMRDAFKDVPPEEIERETDRIIAGIRAAAEELATT